MYAKTHLSALSVSCATYAIGAECEHHNTPKFRTCEAHKQPITYCSMVSWTDFTRAVRAPKPTNRHQSTGQSRSLTGLYMTISGMTDNTCMLISRDFRQKFANPIREFHDPNPQKVYPH